MISLFFGVIWIGFVSDVEFIIWERKVFVSSNVGGFIVVDIFCSWIIFLVEIFFIGIRYIWYFVCVDVFFIFLWYVMEYEYGFDGWDWYGLKYGYVFFSIDFFLGVVFGLLFFIVLYNNVYWCFFWLFFVGNGLGE